jgi:hypothetical protein
MNKISLIALLTMIMTLVSIQVNAQENKSEIVIIRLMEATLTSNGIMVVTHSGKMMKTEQLPAINPKNFYKSGDENAIVLETEINKWKESGFSNITLSSSSTDTHLITTVILSK